MKLNVEDTIRTHLHDSYSSVRFVQSNTNEEVYDSYRGGVRFVQRSTIRTCRGAVLGFVRSLGNQRIWTNLGNFLSVSMHFKEARIAREVSKLNIR